MNNNNVLFIGADYIKKNSSIMDNVENTLIEPHIYDAQNIELQHCIGEDLYDYFVTKLETFQPKDNLEILLGADYFKLFDNYFKPFLIHQTVYYSYYDLYAKTTAKGLVNQTSSYSNTADIKILENQRRDYKIKAEYYRDSMVTYLSTNWSLFPEYTLGCTDCEGTSLAGGLYMGDVPW